MTKRNRVTIRVKKTSRVIALETMSVFIKVNSLVTNYQLVLDKLRQVTLRVNIGKE